MSWDFKNDPFLRTALVLVIGILAFGLLFNSISGGGTSMGGEHMGGMSNYGGYGYSLGSFVGSLLSLLVNILMVVLVIALVVGVVIWIKNAFFKNTNNSKFMQSINSDPILKTVATVTLIILGIVLILALFGSFGQSEMYGGQFGMASEGRMGNYGFSFGNGFSPTNSITGLLTLLVKVLMFVLVISLILAAISYLKSQYDQGNLKLFGTNSNQNTNAGNTASNNHTAAETRNTTNTSE